MEGYFRAKQEEGVFLTDVILSDLSTEYLRQLEIQAQADTKTLQTEAKFLQWSLETHIDVLQDTLDKLLANLDQKRLSTHGHLLGE